MTVESTITVRVLGPVELLGPDGVVIDVPSSSQRRLLAVLALHAPDAVRSGWLCEMLEVTPGALRTSVARLRRVAGDGLVSTAASGYRLDAVVDARLAQAEIEGGDGDPDRLVRALDRWAGRTLEEFCDEPWAVGDARRLDEMRATGVEDLAEIRLGQGDHDRAIADLSVHVSEHPYRDRPRGLLMRALAAAGRQTEALRAFQVYRELLGDTAGTEPSDDLRAIERRIVEGWRGTNEPEPESRRTPSSDGARPAVLDGALHNIAPGVGRNDALDQLADAAHRAVADGATAVLVSGEAGIGKTTLVAEFARAIVGVHGWGFHYDRCDELVTAPYKPFPSVIGWLVDELSETDLHAHGARHGGDLGRLLTTHAARLAGPPSRASDEQTARHLLFEAVTDVVARAAAAKPMVVAIDDLQWAEPAALDLTRHLMRSLGRAPVLFVLVIRETGEAATAHLRGTLADLTRQSVRRVELEGLDRAGLEKLVAARVPATAGHDVGAVADALLTETAGHPLLADHLLAHWDRSGRLVFDAERVTVSSPVDLDLPANLRDLVWSRVSRLGADAAEIMTAAAVLGVEFDERSLAAMVSVDAPAVPPLLDRAVADGLLADLPSRPGTVRFTHALVAHALETDLGARARRDLHAQAFAATLAASGATPREHAPRLVHHARAGGLLDESLHWSIEAGEGALDDLAPHEAVRWFASALEDAATLGRSDAFRAHLLVRLGEARSFAGDPTAHDTIVEGGRIAASCGAHDTLVRAALATDRGTMRIGTPAIEELEIVELALAARPNADTATRARLTALTAQRLVRTDQSERRLAAAHEALDMARSCGDRTIFAGVAARVLYALWAPGAAAARAELAREATAAVREADDPNLVFVVHWAAYCAAVCAGDSVAAAASLDRLHDIADEVRDPQMRWAIGVCDAFVATMEGSFAQAERIVVDTVDLGVQIGVSEAIGVFAAQSFALGTFAGRHAELLPVIEQGIESETTAELAFRLAHAIVCCEVGRPEVAAELLHAAMDGVVEASPDDFLRSTEIVGFAVLALELEDVEAAAWLYPQVVPLADEVSFNSITSQGPIAAYAGKLASILGQTEEAEQFLLAALAIADAFGWRYHRATTLLALAQNRFRAEASLDDEAFAWLDEAGDLCARHGIAVWAGRVDSFRSFVASEAPSPQ